MNIRKTDLENVKKIGIYCITNLLNGKKYIGKTGRKEGFIRRWNNHKNNSHSNCGIYRAFNKYGIDNFEFSILEIIEPIEDINKLNSILNFWERYWIKYYDTYNNGYNMTKGGDGMVGWKPTKEQNEKHKQTLKEGYNTGRIIHWAKGLTKETDERLMRISVTMSDNNNPSKRPEVSYKISYSQKQRYLDNPKLKFNFSINNPMKNINIKNKQIKTIKEQYKNGRKVWNKGLTKETDERLLCASKKQSEIRKNGMYKGKNHPKAKAIVQLTLDGRLVREYDFIKHVEDYNYDCGAVEKCTNHKHITKLGNNIYGKRNEEKYMWLSKEEYNKGDL